MSDQELHAEQSDIEWLHSLNAQYLEDHFAAHYSVEDVNDELNAILAQRNANKNTDKVDTSNATPPNDNTTKLIEEEVLEGAEEAVAGAEAVGAEETIKSQTFSKAAEAATTTQTLCVLCLGSITNFLQPTTNLSLSPMSLSTKLPKQSEPSQRRINAFDKLNKYRHIGELITLVESLKVENECCDYLDMKLLSYNLRPSSDATLICTAKQDAKKRFAEAIVDLDKLFNCTPDALDIVKVTIERFRLMRDEIFAHSAKVRQQFLEQYEKICFGETNDEIRHQLYMELKEFCDMREDIFRIRYDLKINQFNNDIYAQYLSSLKNMAMHIAKFDPTKIKSSFVFSRSRNLQLLQQRDHVNDELVELLNDLLLGKQQLDAQEFSRLEHLYGRQVELMIVKLPELPPAILKESTNNVKSTQSDSKELKYIVHQQQQKQEKTLEQKIMSTPSMYRHQIHPIIYNEQEKRELRESFSRWCHAVQQWERESATARQAHNTNIINYQQH